MRNRPKCVRTSAMCGTRTVYPEVEDLDKEVEPLNGETIESVLMDCAERIMTCFEMNNCDDLVVVHASRNMGLIRFSTNGETYVKFANGDNDFRKIS